MNLKELQQSARTRSPLDLKAVEDALTVKKYPLSIIYVQTFST